MMFEFVSALIEGGRRGLEKTEKTWESAEMQPMEPLNADEWKWDEASLHEQTLHETEQIQEMQLTLQETEMAHYTVDDIGLQAHSSEFGNPDYINEVRDQYPNVEAVLSRQEEILRSNPTDLQVQRADAIIERYKGTVFECELKDTFGSKFETIEVKQQLVQTDLGATKPDIVLHGALENMNIGDMEISKGEDLSIEAKCGSPEYIRSEMGHMLEQVEGHEGNSLIVVSKDYMDINLNVRANFEKLLADKGSHIYVVDVTSLDISSGLFSSLRL